MYHALHGEPEDTKPLDVGLTLVLVLHNLLPDGSRASFSCQTPQNRDLLSHNGTHLQFKGPYLDPKYSQDLHLHSSHLQMGASSCALASPSKRRPEVAHHPFPSPIRGRYDVRP